MFKIEYQYKNYWLHKTYCKAALSGTNELKSEEIIRLTRSKANNKLCTARYWASRSMRSARRLRRTPRWLASMRRHGEPNSNAFFAATTARSTSACRAGQKMIKNKLSPARLFRTGEVEPCRPLRHLRSSRQSPGSASGTSCRSRCWPTRC